MADQHGFDTISFMEHHAAENGYLPAPIVMAVFDVARLFADSGALTLVP